MTLSRAHVITSATADMAVATREAAAGIGAGLVAVLAGILTVAGGRAIRESTPGSARRLREQEGVTEAATATGMTNRRLCRSPTGLSL
jgi:hypothetical protein